MNIGILFYSKTGNTKQIANRIKQQSEKLNHSVNKIEVTPEKQPGFLKAGYSAIKQKSLPVTNDSLDVSSWDFVFIGCPIWAGKPAPFIKTMIQKTDGFDTTKTSVFITCSGSEEPGSKAVKIIKSYLKNQHAHVIEDSLIVHMSRKGKIKKEIPSVEDFVSTILTGD